MSNPVNWENQPHPTRLEVLSRPLASAPNPNTTYSADRSRFPPTHWCDPTFYRRTVYRPDTSDRARQPSMSQEDFLKVRQGLQIPDYQRIKLDHGASYLEISYNIQERSLITPISDLSPEHRPSDLVEHEAKGWTEKDVEDPTFEHDSSKTKGISVTDGVFGSGLAMLWKCNRIKTPSRFTKSDLINNQNDHSGLVDLSKELNSYDFRSTLYIYRPLKDPHPPIKSLTNKYNDRIHNWLAHDQSPGDRQPSDVNTEVSSCGSRLESNTEDEEDDNMTIMSDHTVTLSTIEANRRAEETKRESIYDKRFPRGQNTEMSGFSFSQTSSFSNSRYFEETDE
ncbi:hypothetical protein V866_008658 [Kwoniella sp. B9012]